MLRSNGRKPLSTGTLLLCALAGACASALGTTVARADENGRGPAVDLLPQVVAALSAQAPTTVTRTVATDDWTWTELSYADAPHPLVIDLVASNRQPAPRVLYMLPGAGLNFESDFFTPHGANIAHFMRQNGYLIVGITPREDTFGPSDSLADMASWGMAQHKQDARTIIQIVQGALGLHYDILGHSAGALDALDYAASFSGDKLFHKAMILDIIGTYDPVLEAPQLADAQKSYQAQLDLLAARQYAGTEIAGFKRLVAGATFFPDADSGVPRSVFGGPAGDFTLQGLMFWAFIHTNTLPGQDTPHTGLPQNWYYAQGFLNGVYQFDADPTQDVHFLTVSPVGVAQAAVHAIGSGDFPTAARRDEFAVISNNGTYSIPWGSITKDVVWVDSALGFGDHPYAAQLIRDGGDQDVTYTVVPGYGHADVVFGSNADADVWPLFLQDEGGDSAEN